MTVQHMQGVQRKQVSNDVLRWDNPFRKIDGRSCKGEVVENLSEEFDPGSD